MKDIQTYEGYQFSKGSVTKVSDPLTVESPLQIKINSEAFTVVMQTPGDEEDLVRGLLYAEDVIGQDTQIGLEFETDENDLISTVNCKIDPNQTGDGYLSSRSLLSVSSCGICGKRSLDDLQIKEGKLRNTEPSKWTLAQLFSMQQKMVEAQTNFSQTGGCHGVAAFDQNENLLVIREDIGRHNALDKVVGSLVHSGQLKAAKALTFSGRISYEIVSKAFRAKIPLIMAVSAPSTLAIDFAKEYGITILGFSRQGKATCYANCSVLS